MEDTNDLRTAVRPLSEYRYDFLETGVGCAEHDDPHCLCDVVVTEPVPLRDEAVHYVYGNTSGERPLSRAWLENVLAIHDVLATHERLEAEFPQKFTYLGRAASEDFDYLQFLLDLGSPRCNGKMVAERYALSYEKVTAWRRDLGLTQSRRRRRSANMAA